DADIVWLQNPFQRFDPDADFQIACDRFSGNSFNLRNEPNGGFNYVKSNNRTIEFYKFWYNSRKMFPGLHDQDVLNEIKFDPYIQKIQQKLLILDLHLRTGEILWSCLRIRNHSHDHGLCLKNAERHPFILLTSRLTVFRLLRRRLVLKRAIINDTCFRVSLDFWID
ncbi:hypothetical protein CISIN_1g0169951mg, partial [Citrus sinensis]